MDRPPVRLAVLGSGFGAAVAVPVFATLPGVRLTAVVARRAEKARQVATQYGIEHHAGGYEALDYLDVDAVYIALPPTISGGAVQLAQRRGLHILAEKPLTADPAELAAIAGWPSQRVQMVNYGYPELPAWQHLRRLVHSEVHGRVRLVNVRWLVHSYAEEHRLANWKRNRHQGGGVLPLLGNHLFHYMEWLFGPVRALGAVSHPVSSEEATAEFAPAASGVSLWLTMAQGFPATAVLSNAAPFAVRHEIEVVCDRATIRLTNTGKDYMREFRCTVASAGATAGHRFVLEAGTGDGRAAAFRLLASRFIAAITSPEASPARPGFFDDMRSQTLLAATTRACASGFTQLLGSADPAPHISDAIPVGAPVPEAGFTSSPIG
ncbi:hypothetical protein AYO44_10680 [Planctomycetaceae bacterium SCGC AG-212-F19]|nr:hypothetical protein AYO44_10680 [Planctomycetaceae bacterium SCGC AG-212-F19]